MFILGLTVPLIACGSPTQLRWLTDAAMSRQLVSRVTDAAEGAQSVETLMLAWGERRLLTLIHIWNTQWTHLASSIQDTVKHTVCVEMRFVLMDYSRKKFNWIRPKKRDVHNKISLNVVHQVLNGDLAWLAFAAGSCNAGLKSWSTLGLAAKCAHCVDTLLVVVAHVGALGTLINIWHTSRRPNWLDEDDKDHLHHLFCISG